VDADASLPRNTQQAEGVRVAEHRLGRERLVGERICVDAEAFAEALGL
jgi:hypothetical protein